MLVVACLGFLLLAFHLLSPVLDEHTPEGAQLWLLVTKLAYLNVKRRGGKMVSPLLKNWMWPNGLPMVPSSAVYDYPGCVHRPIPSLLLPSASFRCRKESIAPLASLLHLEPWVT